MKKQTLANIAVVAAFLFTLNLAAQPRGPQKDPRELGPGGGKPAAKPAQPAAKPQQPAPRPATAPARGPVVQTVPTGHKSGPYDQPKPKPAPAAPATKLGPLAQPGPGPKPGPAIGPKPGPAVGPKPGPAVGPKPGPAVGPKPGPAVHPAPAAGPTRGPDVHPAPAPGPKPGPAFHPTPGPKPGPAPHVHPTPAPGPAHHPTPGPGPKPGPAPHHDPHFDHHDGHHGGFFDFFFRPAAPRPHGYRTFPHRHPKSKFTFIWFDYLPSGKVYELKDYVIYECRFCHLVHYSPVIPENALCPAMPGQIHSYQILGYYGDLAFRCATCGVTINSTAIPNVGWCGTQYHVWQQLLEY